MLNIVISFLTFLLIIISLFMVLVILMQRGSSSGGMGSAFGGGVAESAFGAETTNILTRATKWAATAFFVIALILYLLYMSQKGTLGETAESDLPDIAVEEQPAPRQPEAMATDVTRADGTTQPDAATDAQEAMEESGLTDAMPEEATAGETQPETDTVPAPGS